MYKIAGYSSIVHKSKDENPLLSTCAGELQQLVNTHGRAKLNNVAYLGDRLGTFRNGVLRELARENQTNSCLDLP